MGSMKESNSNKNSLSASEDKDMPISGLLVTHEKELENLTLTTQPFKTLKFFILAVIKYLRHSVAYVLSHGGWIMLFSTIIAIAGVLLLTIDGPHEKHVEEVQHYIQFGLWWVSLGVASSIGFASLSGGRVDAMEELDASSSRENGIVSAKLNQIKRWFLSHAQYLNFFTILVLASVPNPLFDLAGIMCGQFGIPFWEFFLATLIGKAIVKTHIQTVFIICVCNNQLLDWMENELIWILSFVPGFNSILPNLITKLHSMKDKYMAMKPNVSSKIEAKKWDFSVALIWNTIVWFMLIGFFVKIVNATAQSYLKKQQEKEIAALKNK